MIVLYDFMATWCGPCKGMTKVLDKVVPHYPEVTLYCIDVDEAVDIVDDYHILNVPTLVLVKDGEETARKVGAVSEEELSKWLEGEIGKCEEEGKIE